MVSPTSPVVEFYKENFQVDSKRKHGGQSIALLEFVDEKRLLEALKPLEDNIKDSKNSILKPLHFENSSIQKGTKNIGGLSNLKEVDKSVQMAEFHMEQHPPVFGKLEGAIFPKIELPLDENRTPGVEHYDKKLQSIVCFKCGKVNKSIGYLTSQFGHYSKECPEPQKTSQARCFHCGTAGHFARECPLKSKDDNPKSPT
jgi:5'-3' exonuclease